MTCRENSHYMNIFYPIRYSKCHFFIVLTLTTYVILCQIKTNRIINGSTSDIPIILWWTPFTGGVEIIKFCSKGSCLFTENRNYIKKYDRTKVILFYGSDFKIEDLPLPRAAEWWGLLHEESPKNQPLFDHLSALKLFNITSTFKFNSGMPLTLQYLQGIDALISNKYYKLAKEKRDFQSHFNLSPIIYLQSDCNPPSERDDFVKELVKYIPVDSYGTCLKNKLLPAHLQGIESMNSHEILELISKYKFSLALENSACADYITEKLWRPLSVGAVPIYWGAPNVENWIPNEGSIINVRNYASTRDLASYLLELLKNDTAYESHLEHKIYKNISNKKLIDELNLRKWGINEDQESKETFVESFECYVCDNINKNKNALSGTIVADLKDYGCPPPETILDKNKAKNFWVEQWFKAKIEADVLADLITRSPGTFTMEHFYSRVLNLLSQEGSYLKKINDNEEL